MKPPATSFTVTFDDQVFTLQPRGGISRYFTELVAALRADSGLGVEPSLPFRYTLNEHLLELEPTQFRRAPVPNIAQRDRILRPLNGMDSRWRSSKHLLVHHTYYLRNALRIPARFRVCTVYDMTPELFPEMFPHGNPHLLKRRYVDECDAIFCISQTTKDDLHAVYGELGKPVVVTPLGVGDDFFHAQSTNSRRPDYVLFVGQRDGYKNFDVLLRAFTRIVTSGEQISLLCVGPPFKPEESERLRDLGVAGVVARRDASDRTLPDLYANARCLVFPSLHEGFGLPIVEAFAAGCPVVAANTPCATEVAATAAQFFAPDDDEELARIILSLVDESGDRCRWMAAGRVRALEFTWTRTAQRTAEVYRELLEAE